jgi:Fur family ferric uptake transcriptional regulator
VKALRIAVVIRIEVGPMIHYRPQPPAGRDGKHSGDPMESQDLRKAGLKVTHPRIRILDVLESSSPRHLTAEDIYRHLLEKGDDIGLATVYRVLTQFEAAGLVLKHNFEGGQAVYELDRGVHHDHMVDVESGKVIEFTSPEIERLQTEIAAKHGYIIEEHSLVLYVRPKKKK